MSERKRAKTKPTRKKIKTSAEQKSKEGDNDSDDSWEDETSSSSENDASDPNIAPSFLTGGSSRDMFLDLGLHGYEESESGQESDGGQESDAGQESNREEEPNAEQESGTEQESEESDEEGPEIPGIDGHERRLLKNRGYHVMSRLSDALTAMLGNSIFHAIGGSNLTVMVPISDSDRDEGGQPPQDCQFDAERDLHVKQISLSGVECALKRVTNREKRDNESRIMMALNHRNITQIYDTFDIGDKHYIAMEYINGRKSFQDFWLEAGEENRIDEFTALLMIRHIAHGLEYMHSRGCAHQDLHGNNMMLHCQDGKMILKLFDFCLSRKQYDADYHPELDFILLGTNLDNLMDHSDLSDATRTTLQTMREQITQTKGKGMSMSAIVQQLSLISDSEDTPEGSTADRFVKTFES